MNKLLKSIACVATGLAMAIGVGVGVGREASAVHAAGGVFDKITSLDDLTSGAKYLIVSEADNVAFNGSLSSIDVTSNTVSVSISNNSISVDSNCFFTITSFNDGYSIKGSGGNYIYSDAANANELKTETSASHTNTITWNGTNFVIRGTNSYLVYNSTSGQTRFRYYKPATCGNGSGKDAYHAISLYKENSGTPIPTTYSVEYDANGGSGTTSDASSPYSSGATATVANNNFIRIGYEFNGWNTKADGSGTNYAEGSNLTVNNDVTLYAQWIVDADGLGTENNPFTVEQAKAAIDNYSIVNNACVEGKISKIDEYLDTYSSITYWISANGQTTNQLKVYSGKGLNGDGFDSISDVSLGASVVILGTLKKYSSDYEFDKNNQLISYTPAQRTLVSIAVSGTYPTSFYVGDSFSHDGVVVTATYSDSSSSVVTNNLSFEGYDMLVANTQTVTVKYEENGVVVSTTYQILVENPTVAESVEFVAGTYVGSQTAQGTYQDVLKKGGVILTAIDSPLGNAQYRIYKDKSMIVSLIPGTNKVIKTITLTCTASGTAQYGSGNLSADGYAYEGSVGTWTGNASSVTFVATAQTRITSVLVTTGENSGSQGGLDYQDDVEALTTRSNLSYTVSKTGGVKHILNNANTIKETTNSYKDWTNSSDAFSGISYSGLSAGGNASIQLRTDGNNSGIVNTSNSRALVASTIKIKWNTNTADARVINIYGSNTAFTAPSNLYSETALTSLAFADKDSNNESTYTFTDSFKYIGIKSKSGAMYIDSVEIQWGDTPVYTYSEAVIRFGGSIDQGLWSDLAAETNIVSYGVMFKTGEVDVEDLFNDNKTDSNTIAQAISAAGITDRSTNIVTGEHETPTPVGGNYVWNLCKRITSQSDLTAKFSAAAYIKVKDDEDNESIIFLQSVSTSAKELAQEMIDDRTNNYDENSFGGSLYKLTTLQ